MPGVPVRAFEFAFRFAQGVSPLPIAVCDKASQRPFRSRSGELEPHDTRFGEWAFQRTVRTLLDLGTGWYGSQRCENMTHWIELTK